MLQPCWKAQEHVRNIWAKGLRLVGLLLVLLKLFVPLVLRSGGVPQGFSMGGVLKQPSGTDARMSFRLSMSARTLSTSA